MPPDMASYMVTRLYPTVANTVGLGRGGVGCKGCV